MNRNNLTLSILTAVILIWAVNAIFTSARSGILDTIRPAIKTIYDISRKFRLSVFPENGLLRRNRLLEEELAVMRNKVSGMDELLLENARLKKFLKFKNKIKANTVPARVIGRDPSNWTSIIFIDKGTKDGIKKYMAVTTDKGLVGRIIDPGLSSAKVIFLTDPDSRIGALIQRTRDDGLVYGTLGMQCQMAYISLDADVWPGDLVVTSGSGKYMPKGLLIGTVEDVFIDKSGLYQTAIIKPAVDLSKVEEVLCVE